jgi:AcrR family transcriptional regulator
MPPKPTYPLDTIHRARRMYEEGAPVRDICAATGMGVGTLYYHLDGFSLPGTAVKRLPRRRGVEGGALIAMPSRERRKLAARLFRAAERQARKIEFRLTFEHQTREGRAEDLAALRELTRVLRDLSAVEDAIARARPRSYDGESVEREEALAVEGRAVFVRRERRG